MELWEFNMYCKGYKEIYYQTDVNIMKLSYNTGQFSKESKHKPKSLESYIDKLDRVYHGNKYKDVPVDVKKSKIIEEKIQKLKEIKKNEK